VGVPGAVNSTVPIKGNVFFKISFWVKEFSKSGALLTNP